jgi:hypothetical protein
MGLAGQTAPNDDSDNSHFRYISSGRGSKSRLSQERELLTTLRREIEWIFSDASLSIDAYMHAAITKALPKGGWLQCEWLAGLEQIQELRPTPEMILEALRKSHLETQVSRDDECFVRRRQPLPPLLRSDCAGFDDDKAHDLSKAVLRDPHGTLNRLQDQQRVWKQLQLREVGDDTTIFYERKLSKEDSSNSPPVMLAHGYERVIYGDDGPYVELTRQQVCWEAWPYSHDKKGIGTSYYDERFTKASHAIWQRRWEQWDDNPTKGLLMLYEQRASVVDRPWAPSANQKPHARREHGYADYRPGYYYMTANGTLIATSKEDAQGPCLVAAPAPTTLSNGQPKVKQRGDFQICWSFKDGKCDRGARCKWLHT